MSLLTVSISLMLMSVQPWLVLIEASSRRCWSWAIFCARESVPFKTLFTTCGPLRTASASSLPGDRRRTPHATRPAGAVLAETSSESRAATRLGRAVRVCASVPASLQTVTEVRSHSYVAASSAVVSPTRRDAWRRRGAFDCPHESNSPFPSRRDGGTCPCRRGSRLRLRPERLRGRRYWCATQVRCWHLTRSKTCRRCALCRRRQSRGCRSWERWMCWMSRWMHWTTTAGSKRTVSKAVTVTPEKRRAAAAAAPRGGTVVDWCLQCPGRHGRGQGYAQRLLGACLRCRVLNGEWSHAPAARPTRRPGTGSEVGGVSRYPWWGDGCVHARAGLDGRAAVVGVVAGLGEAG